MGLTEGLGVAIAVGVYLYVRSVIRQTAARARRLQEENPPSERPSAGAPTKKKKKKKKRNNDPVTPAPTPLRATGAPTRDVDATSKFPETWGWAKLSVGADTRALGYYYRDNSYRDGNGPYCFKILVDLTETTDEVAIREVARAKNYESNLTFRLPGHATTYLRSADREALARAEADFARGHSTADPRSAVVLVLSDDMRRAYALPDAMPHMEAYL